MSRAARFTAALVAVLGTAACGGAEPDGSGGVSSGTDEAFTMPRDTDILVADLHWEAAGPPSIGAPTNITRRVDYDNQPHFTPDGTGLWYTANDPHQGQSDIWRFDLASGMVTRVTTSAPESEYSATPLPDGSGISAIRVEADSTQRLWRFGPDGSGAAVVLEDVAPVGYHAWVDESTVVMFVLGDPPTLQRGNLATGRAEVLAEDIGRSIQPIPGGRDVSFVQRSDDGSTVVMRLPDGGTPEPIVDAIDAGDFHAWTPNGILLMASGAVVHAFDPAGEAGWVPIADFSDLNVTLSRLAVSPDASQIAMVAEPAPIDGLAGN